MLSTWRISQYLEAAQGVLAAAASIPRDHWSGAGRGIYDARVDELRCLLARVEESVGQAEVDIERFRLAADSVEIALWGGQNG